MNIILPVSIVAIFYVVSALFHVPEWIYPSSAALFCIYFTIFLDWKGSKSPSRNTLDMPETYVKELKMAKAVQMGLLSAGPPGYPGIAIAKAYIPADKMSGDFYTFIQQDIAAFEVAPKVPGILEYDTDSPRLGIAIGDVAGHGVASALVMALASGIIREVGKHLASPAETLKQSNREIMKYIENSHVGYVTVFYCILDTVAKTLTYCQGGHPAGLVFRSSGEVTHLETEGMFLGMFDDAEYEEKTIQLNPGDRLFLYTDGITETRNQNGEIFGVERLKKLISGMASKPIDTVKESVLKEANAFSKSKIVKDDQTLVMLEISE